MARTITATYDSADTVDNVVFDLIGTGIPQDNITKDAAGNQVKVTVPEETEPEIRELLQRHDPKSLS